MCSSDLKPSQLAKSDVKVLPESHNAISFQKVKGTIVKTGYCEYFCRPNSTTQEPMSGNKITMSGGKLNVPDQPIIPFIEGDGTGPDIWNASVSVLDASVEKAYGGKRKIQWMEVLAGEKAFNQTGNWLPDETLAAFKEYLVGIKGPLTTPVGGGIR